MQVSNGSCRGHPTVSIVEELRQHIPPTASAKVPTPREHIQDEVAIA